MTKTRLELLQWYALFGGALAWATEHVVGFYTSEAACGGAVGHFDTAAWQITYGVIAGVLVLLAEAAALTVFRATQDAGKDAPGPYGRLHFFATAALLGNVLFLMIVIFDCVGTVYHLPCAGS